MAENESGFAALEWETAIPLLTNPFIWLDLAKALAVPVMVFGGIILAVLAGDDRPNWAGAAGALGIALAVIVALFVLVELAVFRNRIAARFCLDAKGVDYAGGPTPRWLSRAGSIAGLVAGSPRLAGASLIAASADSLRLPWRSLRKATLFPRQRVITLSNSWRPVIRLYCPTAEIYLSASRIVERVLPAAPR